MSDDETRPENQTPVPASEPPAAEGDQAAPAFPAYPPAGAPQAPAPQPGSGPTPGAAPTAPHPGYGPTPPAAAYPPQYAPQPGQPYPGQPYLGQPAPPQPPRRGLGVGAIIAIAAGGAVLLVVAVVVIVLLVAHSVSSSLGQGGGQGSQNSPSAAVTHYLNAIADGDSAAALALLSSPPTDTTLLTDEVLAASAALAPITQIEVSGEQQSSGSADVTASYLLGGTPVQTQFSVLDYDDDGSWQISGGTGYLELTKFDGLGLEVNGQAVTASEAEVFPGAYQLATTLPNFMLTGDTTVVVTDPFTSADTTGIEPGLTDAATAQFRSLVKAAVDACMASTTLAAGCGLDLPPSLTDGTQLTEGTITRTLPADTAATLDSLKVTLSYDNPTLAEGEYVGAIDVSAQCTQSGATGTCSVLFGPSLGQPSIDMASPNPTVVWG